MALLVTQPAIANRIDDLIEHNDVVIFAKTTCPYCKQVFALFDSHKQKYEVVFLDTDPDGPSIRNELILKTAQATVPNVFIRRLHIGGCDKTKDLEKSGALVDLLNPPDPVAFGLGDAEKVDDLPEVSKEFDLIVIGGGSGGNACVKDALAFGAKACVLDFVKPSPAGTTWGYGGTCVNVGCIPKKLMHQAALIGEYIKDAESFGWDVDHSKVKCDWANLVSAVGDHIHSLNFNYRMSLRKLSKEAYINAYAEFIDAHRLKCVDKKGEVSVISSKNFVIATGGRPHYPGIPGDKEYGISSDDIFWLPYHPGKTLIVGASYIALECASFLREIGCDVTVMVRSIFLRGFDQPMAQRVASYLEFLGVKFMSKTVPDRIEQLEAGSPGRLRVHFRPAEGDGEGGSDEWNSVIFAIGRKPCLRDLHLERAGVLLSPMNGKIVTMNEQSSVGHIYALGDCAHENRQPFAKALELTPVAIKAGQAIAKRLFGEARYPVKVDYNFVPTTVFTSLEYGSCGFSEDDAVRLYKERVDVYHKELQPFEWTVPHRASDACYLKLVVLKSEDPGETGPEHELVIGFHYVGPFAGELTQGFALALKKSCTKADFDDLVGIHPTCAETVTKMNTTKRSGKDISATGC